MTIDHRKQYHIVNGCKVTLSFAEKPDVTLYGRLKSILLSEEQTSHICPGDRRDGMLEAPKKEA